MNTLSTLPLHLLVAGGLLTALVLSFVTIFLLPAVVHWQRLRGLQRAISKLETRTPPGELRKLFAADRRLAHLWKEYEDSLHIQREERDGQAVAVAVRSTLPAETFFNSQFVVDARLRTEFFKHLPGIFTGIGIIGTFTGLIEGLRQFQVSENAATVRASLESLMHSVGEAFLISASAIAAAMIVTFLEKLLLASLYGRIEEIAHAIDARFDAGAGADYMSRLVKASEDSAVQSKRLRDTLVKDLAELLREATSAQLAAAREQHELLAKRMEETSQRRIDAAREDAERLGATIAESVEQSLRAPLQGIADIVKAASGEQSSAASNMLAEVMERFGERLNSVFGGQVSGLSTLNQQTAQAMQEMLQTLQALTGSLASAGRDSTEAMAHQVGQILATLGESQARAVHTSHEREQALADRSTGALHTMSETVEEALREMGAASAQMARSVEVLSQTTSSSLDKMNAGAQQLQAASIGFATAGERVSGVMGQASEASSRLAEASSSLAGSASTLQDGLGDYRAHRESVGLVVTELRTTVELARKEASITADVLGRMEGSTQRLAEAQKQADQYLSGVSKVLGDAHQAFATSVKKTLELANAEFHTKLATAVGLLSSTIGELEATIGTASWQKSKP